VSEPVYSRSPGVVWRLGPDRVLVRRVDASGGSESVDRASRPHEMVELVGAVALVWAALDEPATERELEERLRQAGAETGDLGGEVAALVDARLVDSC
jgi:hypothetical protein